MLDQILKMYDDGAIATREAAQKVLWYITESNKANVIEKIQKRPHLNESVKEAVCNFKSLTEEQWSRIVTFEPGAYTLWTEQNEIDRKARHKQEHQMLRAGVEVMKDYA